MNIKRIINITIGLMITLNCFSQNIFYQQQSELSRTGMIENLRTYITKEMSKNKIIGLSIAVVDTNGILLSEGFGMADKKNNIPTNNSTLFPIASVTKTFTGIAVMQIVEKGLIDLDKPIVNYIPELSLPNSEEKIITTRMLLTHHSGIHGDILYNWYLPDISNNPMIYEQVTDLINDVGTVFPPGKLHSYSNSGYSLLGVLIHKVSGLGYTDYIRSNIFEPLGMNNSIVFAGEKTNCFISKGYNGIDTTSMPMKLGIPAGGIALTANDAAKYMLGIIDSYHGADVLLKSENMRTMMTQQNKDIVLDKGFSIGLTWFLQDQINVVTKYAAHRGELPPYHSMLIILPEMKIGVFVSINTNNAANVPEELAHKIVYNLYEHQAGNSIPQIQFANKINLSKEQLIKYEGTYPNVYFGPMTVKLKGEKLLVKSPVMPMPLVLTPHADSTFSLKVRMLGFSFSLKLFNDMKIEFRENKGERYMNFIIQDRILNPNLRIEHFDIQEEYKKYEGIYKVVNMENSERVVKDVKIKFYGKDEFFMFKYTFLGRHKFNMVLQPIDNQNAKFAGVGYFLGDKICWEKTGNKIFMYWSGLKLEKI